MAKAKIKEDFFEYEIPAKIQYGRDRVEDTNGNPVITVPDPPLIDLIAINDELEDDYGDAQGGNENQQETLAATVKEWNTKFHRFVDTCNLACDGDTVKITSLGFSYTDVDRTKRPAPPKVEGLKASYVNSEGTSEPGAVYVSNNKMDDSLIDCLITIASTKADIDQLIVVQGNQVVIPAINEPVVIGHSTSSRKALKMLLTPALRWHILRYAVNSTGKGPNSDKVSIIAPGN